MRARCNNPNASDYPKYGGRGITICDRWDSFANFIEDLGERPDGLTLERRDVYGNYEPTNCYWATLSVQTENRRPYLRESRAPEPYIRKRGNSFVLAITVAHKTYFYKRSLDLELLREIRAACIFVRDFRISRGLYKCV